MYSVCLVHMDSWTVTYTSLPITNVPTLPPKHTVQSPNLSLMLTQGGKKMPLCNSSMIIWFNYLWLKTFILSAHSCGYWLWSLLKCICLLWSIILKLEGLHVFLASVIDRLPDKIKWGLPGRTFVIIELRAFVQPSCNMINHSSISVIDYTGSARRSAREAQVELAFTISLQQSELLHWSHIILCSRYSN